MSYTTPAAARDLVQVDLSQKLLDAAQSILNQHSMYRWAETTLTEEYSGDGESHSLFVRSPIITVDSIAVVYAPGDTSNALTENTDFNVRKKLGEIYFYSAMVFGFDNYTIVYKYGFVSGDQGYDDYFQSVQLAEAQVALHLKRNPGMLAELNFGRGVNLRFDAGIAKPLALVPKPISVVAI